MTDTDKLKRLALRLADEAIRLSRGPNPVSVRRAYEADGNSRAILALIAENERLRSEIDHHAIMAGLKDAVDMSEGA